MNEVLADKLTDLEECIARIREDWERSSDVPFEQDRVKRQLVILNLQLAFQNLLDMANHLVRTRKLGWPKDNAETFVGTTALSPQAHHQFQSCIHGSDGSAG